EGLSDALTDWLLMNLVREDEGFRWRFDRRALAELHPRVNREDLWPVVERHGARVRCIRGALAPYVTGADVERFRANGCRVDTLEGAGHFVHVDRPAELLSLLTDI
ncbi:MAG: alpha/beta fold hydrolase, partial [Myxococcales bacterium]